MFATCRHDLPAAARSRFLQRWHRHAAGPTLKRPKRSSAARPRSSRPIRYRSRVPAHFRRQWPARHRPQKDRRGPAPNSSGPCRRSWRDRRRPVASAARAVAATAAAASARHNAVSRRRRSVLAVGNKIADEMQTAELRAPRVAAIWSAGNHHQAAIRPCRRSWRHHLGAEPDGAHRDARRYREQRQILALG